MKTFVVKQFLCNTSDLNWISWRKVVLVGKWNYKNFLIAKHTLDLNHVAFEERVGHNASDKLKKLSLEIFF